MPATFLLRPSLPKAATWKRAPSPDRLAATNETPSCFLLSRTTTISRPSCTPSDLPPPQPPTPLTKICLLHRHIFSTKWVNQLRFLFGHNDNPTTSNVASPQLLVQGVFTGGGAQADLHRTEAHFDGTDVVTYTNGRHMLVFGVDVPDLSRRG